MKLEYNGHVFDKLNGICEKCGDHVARVITQPCSEALMPYNPPQQKAEPALRYDGDKSRVDLIPPDFIEALGRHYGVGAKKYPERNWEEGMSWSRCYASAQRHMLAFWRGEDIDAETGTPHVIAAAWNMAALHWYQLHGMGTDDRTRISHGDENSA